jgi:hypothetical protein
MSRPSSGQLTIVAVVRIAQQRDRRTRHWIPGWLSLRLRLALLLAVLVVVQGVRLTSGLLHGPGGEQSRAREEQLLSGEVALQAGQWAGTGARRARPTGAPHSMTVQVAATVVVVVIGLGRLGCEPLLVLWWREKLAEQVEVVRMTGDNLAGTPLLLRGQERRWALGTLALPRWSQWSTGRWLGPAEREGRWHRATWAVLPRYRCCLVPVQARVLLLVGLLCHRERTLHRLRLWTGARQRRRIDTKRLPQRQPCSPRPAMMTQTQRQAESPGRTTLVSASWRRTSHQPHQPRYLVCR